MFRPESLAALDGLDRVLGTLERLSARAARRYHIVVLSDHGQSQGQTFRDRFGEDLGEVCTQLMKEDVASLDAPVEDWGRADSLAKDLAGGGISGRAARRAAAATSRRVDQAAEATNAAAVSVLGSGNLGLLYVHSPVRLTLQDLQERWPGLVPGLCAHEGIGFVAGLDSAGVPWVLGEKGTVRLDTGQVTGQDPLAPYGNHAARMLQRAVMMPEAPDRTSTAASVTSPSISRHSNHSSALTAAWAAGRTVRSFSPLGRSQRSYRQNASKAPITSTLCWSRCFVRSASARRCPIEGCRKAL